MKKVNYEASSFPPSEGAGRPHTVTSLPRGREKRKGTPPGGGYSTATHRHFPPDVKKMNSNENQTERPQTVWTVWTE